MRNSRKAALELRERERMGGGGFFQRASDVCAHQLSGFNHQVLMSPARTALDWSKYIIPLGILAFQFFGWWSNVSTQETPNFELVPAPDPPKVLKSEFSQFF